MMGERVQLLQQLQEELAKAMNTAHRLNALLPMKETSDWSMSTLRLHQECELKLKLAELVKDTLPEGFI